MRCGLAAGRADGIRSDPHRGVSQPYIDLMVVPGIMASSGETISGGASARCPPIVAKQEMANVRAKGNFAVLNVGSPMAEFLRLSTIQVRDGIVGSGSVSAAQFDTAITLLRDPGFWAFGPAGVAVRGKTALIAAAKL